MGLYYVSSLHAPSGCGSILKLQSGGYIVLSTQNAITKHYRLGDLDCGVLFSHYSEG